MVVVVVPEFIDVPSHQRWPGVPSIPASCAPAIGPPTGGQWPTCYHLASGLARGAPVTHQGLIKTHRAEERDRRGVSAAQTGNIARWCCHSVCVIHGECNPPAHHDVGAGVEAAPSLRPTPVAATCSFLEFLITFVITHYKELHYVWCTSVRKVVHVV